MLIELAKLTSLPTLTTDRLTLRSLADDDVEDLFATFSDPEAMRHWSTPPHPSRQETAALITQIRDGFDDRSVLQWGIERDEDGRVLGTVTLLPDGEQPRAELGFILGRQHWGQGYANEAQRRVVDFAFHDLHLHRLEGDTDPRNVAAVRSLERLGFRIEGLQRERWIVGGERTDSVVLGLLAHEWEA